VRNTFKIKGGRGYRSGSRRGGGSREVGVKKPLEFTIAVGKGIFQKNVFNQNPVGLGARRGGGGDQSPVGKVPRTPKVNRCSISVTSDEHVVTQLNVWESVVVGRQVEKNFGTHSKEGDIESPNVFESRLDRKNLFSANESLIGIGGTVERENFKDDRLDFFPNGGREDKKKGNVGEKGNNEDICVKDTSRERE
jgi:hypothetical protein